MRIGITGHRGLPEELEGVVRAMLAQELAQAGAQLTGVSCIADGPDAWFAEEVLARGGRLEVVIPAEAYRAGLPPEYHETYDHLLRSAAEVHDTGLAVADEQAHMRGSELLVQRVERLLAVWDGRPARGYGGTADVVAYAGRFGVPVTVLWPDGAVR
ncbi:hypothetical protein [Kitasatospora viridis]|uniref:Uncharacterized protein n=1 Tax=Kitasatospora viridis TaxID=281105 RepID=A0A561UH38_9ACTN|nr:hypothetical protein [Kitasatospora viridis]TWF98676.1 hypothetical protein FHX73_112497 [Kitasatospora viridis]